MGLEFQYLSRISGDPIFADKVEVAMDHIFDRMPADDGLFPNYINPVTGDWGANETSVGAYDRNFDIIFWTISPAVLGPTLPGTRRVVCSTW